MQEILNWLGQHILDICFVGIVVWLIVKYKRGIILKYKSLKAKILSKSQKENKSEDTRHSEECKENIEGGK